MTSSRPKRPAALATSAVALADAQAGRWGLVDGRLVLDETAQHILGCAESCLDLVTWLDSLCPHEAVRVRAALALDAPSMALTLSAAGNTVIMKGRRTQTAQVSAAPSHEPALDQWQGLLMAFPALPAETQTQTPTHTPTQSVSRDTFVASISHELRTPLNAILGFNRMACAEGAPPLVQRHLNHIGNAARVMLHVVNDLLDLTRLEAGQLDIDADQALHVPGLLTRVGVLAQGLLLQRPVAIYTIMDPSCPPHLRGDTLRIEQVLNNLVSNALKFTQQGSVTLGVKVKALTDDWVTLRWSVADTGMGIVPGQLGRVGEPFVQVEQPAATRATGTGLGLSVVRRLLELHGTQLKLASVPGGGTMAWFDLSLPLDRCAPTLARPAETVVCSQDARLRDTVATQWAAYGKALLPAQARDKAKYWVVDTTSPQAEAWVQQARRENRIALCVSATPPEAGSMARPLPTLGSALWTEAHEQASAERASMWGLRALVLDDNPLNQQVLKEHLQRMGMQVALAGDGHHALQSLAAAGSGTSAFDVAIFDIELPGESGLAVARCMRNMPAGQNLPLIFLSAHLDMQHRLEAQELQALGCLLKPFDPDELLALLERAKPLPGRRTARPAASAPTPAPTRSPLQGLFAQQWPTLRPAMVQTGAVADMLAAVHALRGSLAVMREGQALGLARTVEEGLRAGRPAAELPLQRLLELADQLAEPLADHRPDLLPDRSALA